MEILSDFKNSLTNSYAIQLKEYFHKLEILAKGDEKILDIEIQNLPLGLTFDKRTLTISGILDEINKFHKSYNYIAKSIRKMKNDSIPYPDCYKSLDELVPLRAKDLKKMYHLHYSGCNFGKFGAIAYEKDGHIIKQILKIIITYEKSFKINKYEVFKTMILQVSNSPKKFVYDYGNEYDLCRENGEKLTPDEYLNYLSEINTPLTD